MVFSWSDYSLVHRPTTQPDPAPTQIGLGFRSSLGTRSNKLLLPLIIVAPKALKSPYLQGDNNKLVLVEILFPTSSLPD